ncbi:hypothetical protein R6Q57_028441 [Mikania cordata]
MGLEKLSLLSHSLGLPKEELGPMQLQDSRALTIAETFSRKKWRHTKNLQRLEPYICDTVHYVNESISQKKKILVEGGQATMLDIDFGTYPFVTSSSPSAGGICTGLGIAPRVLGDVIGVGRPRRCGWLDIIALKYVCQINGFSGLNLTKLDVLSDLAEIKLGVSDGTPMNTFPADLSDLEQSNVEYETMPGWQADISSVRSYLDLPKTARKYVERIEQLVGVPIHYISVGPGRSALI